MKLITYRPGKYRTFSPTVLAEFVGEIPKLYTAGLRNILQFWHVLNMKGCCLVVLHGFSFRRNRKIAIMEVSKKVKHQIGMG